DDGLAAGERPGLRHLRILADVDVDRAVSDGGGAERHGGTGDDGAGALVDDDARGGVGRGVDALERGDEVDGAAAPAPPDGDGDGGRVAEAGGRVADGGVHRGGDARRGGEVGLAEEEHDLVARRDAGGVLLYARPAGDAACGRVVLLGARARAALGG